MKVEQLKEYPQPTEMADLAIDPWDAVWSNGGVVATVHNLGNSKAEKISVGLFNGNKLIAEKVIGMLEAPTDFIAKKEQIVFEHIPISPTLRIVVDYNNKIKEILEQNNATAVDVPGSKHADPVLWNIYQGKMEEAWQILRKGD